MPKSTPLSCIQLLPHYQVYFALQDILKFRKQEDATEPYVANGEAVSPVEYCIKITHAQTGLRGQGYHHGEFANYHITFPIYWLFMMNHISKTFRHLQIMADSCECYEAWHTTPS
jgi:hypothetical protein